MDMSDIFRLLFFHLEQVLIKMTSSKPKSGDEHLLLPRGTLEEVSGRYLFLYPALMAAERGIPSSLPVTFNGSGDKPPSILDSCWDLAVYLGFGCRVLCQRVSFFVSRYTHVSRYPYERDLLALVLEF